MWMMVCAVPVLLLLLLLLLLHQAVPPADMCMCHDVPLPRQNACMAGTHESNGSQA